MAWGLALAVSVTATAGTGEINSGGMNPLCTTRLSDIVTYYPGPTKPQSDLECY
jgi:hypothetical protein